ncbi:MAG: hypothetical protein A2086_13480 [Spirochaetes bacterium GWD1_27_9]|nr:MAG: hypothetical protein A2Z98_02780 [Spirochaetes bacterium GWB1_27_13]OHD23106.1 MAG: hypothetical protein A2Y34_16965 [Spirochaetes bacterium GWC1_27_15]OHD39918.1 MAG: hypothetical protein A2086_13480 [Spirochaetes bacterium GWD1_27_9]
MIIKEVALSNWRKIDNLKLDFSQGINLIYGRNEIGKSTIIEALNYGFTKEPSSASEDLELIVSWGKKLKASVRIKFENKDGKNYIVEKSFPKGEGKIYFVNDKNEETKIFEGKKIQNELLNIIDIKEETLGLFNLLWIDQGKTLSIFDKKDKNLNSDIQNLIKDIIKKNIISQKTEAFYNEIITNYEKIFDSKDKPRKNTEINILIEKQTNLKNDIFIIDEKLKDYETKIKLLQKISEETSSYDMKIAEKKEFILKLEQKKQEIEKINKKEFDLKLIKDKYIEILKLNEEEDKIKSDYPRLLQKKSFLLEEKLLKINSEIERITVAKEKIEEIKKKLSNYKVNSEEIIKEIEKISIEMEKLNIKLSSSKLKITINPYKKINFDIQIDNKDKRSIETSEEKEFFVNKNFSIDYENNFNLTVTGPLSQKEFEKINLSIEEDNSKLQNIFNKVECTDVDKIKLQYEEYKNLLKEKENIENSLKYYQNTDFINEKEKIVSDIKTIEEKLKNTENNFNFEKPAGNLDTLLNQVEKEIVFLESRISPLVNRKKVVLNDTNFEKVQEEYLSLKSEFENFQKKILQLEPIEIKMIDDDFIKRARNEVERLISDKNSKERQKIEFEVELKQIGDILNQKSALDYELKEIENKIIEEKTKLYSLKLLKEMIETEKKELDTTIVLPLQQKLAKAFETVTKSNYNNISLLNDFSIKDLGVSLFDDSQKNIDIQDISFGTKEQLSFLFRFVVAQYLSQKETQIMILDDSFVNTDKDRLDILVNMLNDFSDKIQFMIFTCKSDFNHYDFNVIDLTQILN